MQTLEALYPRSVLARVALCAASWCGCGGSRRHHGGDEPDAGFVADGSRPLDAGGSSADGGHTDVDAHGASDGADTCTDAPTIGAGTFEGTTSGARDDYTGGPGTVTEGAGCLEIPTRGLDVAYRLDAPPRTHVSVVLSPVEHAYDPALSVILRTPAEDPELACSVPSLGLATVCVTAKNDAGPGAAETATFDNRDTAIEPVYLVIDSVTPGAGGRFALTVTFTPLGDGLAGDDCATAQAVAVPSSFSGNLDGYAQDSFGDSETPSCGLGAGATGPDRVFRAIVPAHKRIVASVVPADPTSYAFEPLVYFVDGDVSACTLTPHCAGQIVTLPPPSFSAAQFTNDSSTDHAVFLFVDELNATTAPTDFTLTTSLEDPQTGTGCDDPTPLTLDTTMHDTLYGYGPNVTRLCSVQARSRTFELTIPPGRIVHATLDADIEWSVARGLSLLEAPGTHDCTGAGSQCDTRAVATMSHDAFIDYYNGTASAQSRTLVVSDTAYGGAFTLVTQTSSGDASIGATCDHPIEIASLPSDASYDSSTGHNLYPFPNDWTSATSAPCLVGDLGHERIFHVHVPSGRTLSAQATGDGSVFGEPSVALVVGPASACAGPTPTCVARGFRAPITYMNTTASTQDVFVFVDWTRVTVAEDVPLEGGPFRLQLSAM